MSEATEQRNYSRRCDGCAHWDPKSDDVDQAPEGLGECTKPVAFWDATEWDHDMEHRTMLPEHATARFFAQDGSDYKAIVITRADFYCADHEPAGPTVTIDGPMRQQP